MAAATPWSIHSSEEAGATTASTSSWVMSPLAISSLVLPTDVFMCPPLCAAAQGYLRCREYTCGAIDWRRALGGATTSTYALWIVAAFVMTALWALVVVVNKKILESVTPVAVNFFIRLVAIGGLLAITVPLTALHLWSNGFGINAAAAGWIALAAVGTWVVAFNAYYFALRGERVAVIAPITSTDPIWTAFFAWVIVGTAFGAATIAGMAVTMSGVVLISRWMGDGEDVPGAELTGAAALAGAAHGEVLPDDRARPRPALPPPPAARSALPPPSRPAPRRG